MIHYGDDVPYSQMIDQSPAALRKRGYDAIHAPNEKVWIVFDAEQVMVQNQNYRDDQNDEAKNAREAHALGGQADESQGSADDADDAEEAEAHCCVPAP